MRTCSAPAMSSAIHRSLLLAWAHWRSGVLLCEWNRLQEAEAAAQQLLALDPLPESVRPTPEFALFGLRIQAHVALAQGNSEWVRQLLEREELDVARFPIPQAMKDVLILVPVRLALACGQMEPALHWAATCGLRYDDPLTTPLAEAALRALCRVGACFDRAWTRPPECLVARSSADAVGPFAGDRRRAQALRADASRSKCCLRWRCTPRARPSRHFPRWDPSSLRPNRRAIYASLPTRAR